MRILRAGECASGPVVFANNCIAFGVVMAPLQMERKVGRGRGFKLRIAATTTEQLCLEGPLTGTTRPSGLGALRAINRPTL